MRLLPRKLLLKTSSVDHADWNFEPIVGTISRLRFKLALSLIPKVSIGRLLEIGYGSAVFFPELSRRCEELFGIDVHNQHAEIRSVLEKHGIVAHLSSGNVTAMEYATDYFDCIITISTLEFVDDIQSACAEIARILKPQGHFIVVTPGHSRLLDAGLKILTGESASNDFKRRREAVLPAIGKHFVEEKRAIVPFLGGPIYTALRVCKPPSYVIFE